MKLEIESVSFKNFLSFGSKVQEVNFLRGLNLVTGQDIDRKKSNGAGKSSFLETVPFALFGRVHREIKKDQIINWKNRKNCEVIINFQKGKNLFTVLRAIKPNKLEIYCDGALIDRPAHVKDYQKTLDEILSINYQTFMSVVHSNINSSAKILSMSKPNKRKFIETIFGLEVYTRLNEKCNLKLKTLKDKIRELDIYNQANHRVHSDIEERVSEAHKKVKTLLLPQQEFEQAKETLKELEDEFPNISEDLQTLKDKQEQSLADIHYNKTLIDSIKNRGQQFLATKIKSLIGSMTDLEPQIESLHDYEILIKKYGSQDKVADDVKKLSDTAIKLADEMSEMKSREAVLKENVKTCIRDINSLAKKIQILSQDICPECGQKIESDDILSNSREEIDVLKKEIVHMEKELEITTNEITTTNRERQTVLKENSQLEQIKRSMFNKMEQSSGVKLDDYEKWKKDLVRYQTAKRKLDNVSFYIIAENDELHKENMALSRKIEEMEHNFFKISQLTNNMRQLEIKADSVDSMIKQQNEIIYTEQNKGKKILVEVRTNQKKKEKLNELKDYLEYIKFICKDENIKQEAISNIMPFMTKQTNFYLSEVDYGFYTILDKFLDAEIKGAGITNASYNSLSGGEGRGIDIALQLAFLDIARVQAGVFPDFLTFDELLDSSIDASGITELFKIIKIKQKDDDSKVFIISHRSELDNMDDVDNVYHVVKENGYSRIHTNIKN